MTVPFRTTRPLGTAVVALLAVQIAFLLLRAIAYLQRSSLVQRIRAGRFVTKSEADASDGFVAAVGGLWLLIFLACVVVWLVWQFRSQTNARELTEGGTQYSPGWAVGWWFVPFANLGMPYATVRELWKASVGRDAWRTQATWPVLGWWWASWLAFNLSSVFSGTGDSSDLATLIRADRIRGASMVLGMVSAGLAIWVVRAITTRQGSAIAAAALPTMPPAPPPAPPKPII